jgi:hypothetical protein
MISSKRDDRKILKTLIISHTAITRFGYCSFGKKSSAVRQVASLNPSSEQALT